MHNIKDLELRKYLLPLYDKTRNPDAREMLLDIVTSLPGSTGEILEKQAIPKAFIQHKYHRLQFDYNPYDYTEVVTFLRQLQELDLSVSNGWLWQLMNRKESRNEFLRLAGGVSQVVIFLDHLRKYFTVIKPERLPAPLSGKLVHMRGLLEKIAPEKYVMICRAGEIKPRMVQQLVLLFTKEITGGDWLIFWQAFNELEAWISISAAIMANNMAFPVFDATQFTLLDFYHPGIKQPVKNSVQGSGRVLLLTGPNMSGKSTQLKSIGICVFLAHAGLAVPAASCVIPYFDDIDVLIQLSDDLMNGYSHFMMEVKQLKSVVERATAGACCFAVFDELFRGTNVDDATDISLQTISGLLSAPGGFFIISTHLHQLESLLEINSRLLTYYMDCNLEGEWPRFTYQLKEGWSSLKIGRIIFNQEGLPALLRQWK
ncbi:hypothetical protein [Chitinophaga sp. Cy-1792]|uniref:MutS-related protein n=1 Tax=Chitinophaga sp. Cy-1792 TaxID=2608339 RepID=UPI0014217D2D|nr:hypothetical protein [Chitinophaga sp. Cy-1792]NIG56933.1 hypothetical protein [Chitinophaga sp. Cy-1792]